MRGSLRIGRLLGVPVEVSWSVVAVGLLVAWSISTPLMDRSGVSSGVAIGLGAAFVIAYLASVVVHELGHTLAAKHYGIGVRRISLVFYGGAAELERAPKDAVSEFWVALAGPIASALCAAVSAVAYVAADDRGLSNSADVLVILVWANVLMVIVNLMPARPLDGGRVAGALIWWASGRRNLATKTITVSGAVLGLALVIAGVGGIFRDGRVLGIPLWWALMLGGFLLVAADVRGLFAPSGVALEHAHPVTDPQPAQAPVSWMMLGVGRGSADDAWIPLVDDERSPVGIVSVAQVRQSSRSGDGRTTVASLATPLSEVAYATPNEAMREVDVRRRAAPSALALVMADGALLGVVDRPLRSGESVEPGRPVQLFAPGSTVVPSGATGASSLNTTVTSS